MSLLLRLLPQSLALRVYVLYSAVLLLFVGAALGGFYHYQLSKEIDDAHETAMHLLEVMVQTVSDSAVIGDYDTINRMLGRATIRSQFASASFNDLRGGVLLAKNPEAPVHAPPRWLVEQVQTQLYDINRTISVGGRDYGVLRLTFAAELIAERFWNLWRAALLLALGALAGGLLLIWVPLMRWLGNLSRVRSFEAEIQTGELDPRQLLSNDAPLEIRQTVEVLNRAALNLQVQRERAAVTLNAITDGVLTCDASGRVMYANPAAERMFGRARAALDGMSLHQLLPEAFAADEKLASWSGRRIELQGERGRRILDASLSVIAGRDAETLGYVLACRDVTESHELDQRLRDQLQAREAALISLRKVLADLVPASHPFREASFDDLEAASALVADLVRERESSRRALDNQKFALDQHAIVSVTDREGKITYANERFCKLSGYTLDELIGKTHRIVKSGLHPESLYREMWDTITAGKVWQGEVCNLSKDGRLSWFSTTIVPLLGADGSPEEYIGIRTDISARKATELALQQAKEAAESANRAKSDFLANMSHEIRTPMNGIIGMTELVLDTELDPQQREYLSIVRSSAEALLGIINEILDFSKIEAGKLLIETIPFSLRRLSEDTLRPMLLPAHAKGLQLNTELDENLPELLMGDPGRLRQVLINLVGNAIKFTEAGEVLVAVRVVRRQDDRVLLHFSVSDTGVGISPDKLTQIFEAFVQEDSSTSRRYGGTGLGLSISRRLVELMGGQMWAESEPGRGSVFHFTIEFELGSNSPAQLAERPSLAGRRVLVVDDHGVSREVLVRMLEQWGVLAEAVPSGRAAIDLMLSSERFDAILLDARMPELDGYQLAGLLSQPVYDKVRAPIIMLSAHGPSESSERLQQLGVMAYLTKPAVSSELEAALLRAISSPSVREQPQAERASQPEPVSAASPSPRILLVEDNVINQKLAVALLGKRAYRVDIAMNGEQALEMLATGHYDAVLMDMQMPVLDGLEATRRIRARELEQGLTRLPIIAMTANAMESDREACLAAGMDAYLSKPIRPDELYATLEELLTSRQ